MSQVDAERQDLSEDEDVSSEKLVPVSEAIRYRKRAQTAENQVVDLQKQLEQSVNDNKKLSEKLAGIETEHRLIEKLSAVGACDLETAIALAKSRMSETEEMDVDTVVEQLRNEKDYLFDASGEEAVVSKTASVREKQTSGRRLLETSAKRAAASGSRADVQEYLRVRRQFV